MVHLGALPPQSFELMAIWLPNATTATLCRLPLRVMFLALKNAPPARWPLEPRRALRAAPRSPAHHYGIGLPPSCRLRIAVGS